MNKKAYVYYYKWNSWNRTEYVKIIAVSEKQAQHFFYKTDFAKFPIHSYRPCDVIEVGNCKWEIGAVLGQDANVYEL